MISSEHIAIKTLYEQENLTPEQIAEVQDMDVVAIKAALCQCSSKFRKDAGQETEEDHTLNFDNDQLRRANETIVSIMLSAEDDSIRLKAAMYVRDDKKGRKEVIKSMQGNTFNILQFNESLKQARAGANAITSKFINKPIPV